MAKSDAPGWVAAGPLGALLVSAGLGSRGGLEQALAELGVTSDAAAAARRVLQGAVLVSGSVACDSGEQQVLAMQTSMFWRVPLTAPLERLAVVTAPRSYVARATSR